MHPKNMNRDHNHHAPKNNEDAERHAFLRSRVRELAEYIESDVPPGRERSLAHTKLEEAMFWANAAIARSRYDADNKD